MRRHPDRLALKGHLDLLLLAVLATRPGHGYAVIAALRERSDGAFDLPEGTVYPALHRLEQDGLVASRWDELGGRRRRIYRLTPPGQAALVEHQTSWRTLAGGMEAVLTWTN